MVKPDLFDWLQDKNQRPFPIEPCSNEDLAREEMITMRQNMNQKNHEHLTF